MIKCQLQNELLSSLFGCIKQLRDINQTLTIVTSLRERRAKNFVLCEIRIPFCLISDVIKFLKSYRDFMKPKRQNAFEQAYINARVSVHILCDASGRTRGNVKAV
jgi:hypothetical protein